MTWEPKRCGVHRCGVAAAVVIDLLVARQASERFGALMTEKRSGLCTSHWRTLYPLAIAGPVGELEAGGAGGSRERDAPDPGAQAPPATAQRGRRERRAAGERKRNG